MAIRVDMQDASGGRQMRAFFERNGPLLGSLLIVTVGFWILVLIILPQLSMLDISFRYNLPPALIGSEQDVYTTANYQHLLFGNQGNPDRLSFFGYTTDIPLNRVDLAVFFKTLLVAVLITIFDLILCYPLAYYLGQSAAGQSGRISGAAADHPLLDQRDSARLRLSYHLRHFRPDQHRAARPRGDRRAP